MLGEHSPKLDHLGSMEIYLGDGSKIIYHDGKISRMVDGTEHLLRQWDPEQGRWIDLDDPGSGAPVPTK
jgi:hypothetical protein